MAPQRPRVLHRSIQAAFKFGMVPGALCKPVPESSALSDVMNPGEREELSMKTMRLGTSAGLLLTNAAHLVVDRSSLRR